MAYRYNNGYGAITCDRCEIVIATGYDAELMAKDDADEDVCEECLIIATVASESSHN